MIFLIDIVVKPECLDRPVTYHNIFLIDYAIKKNLQKDAYVFKKMLMFLKKLFFIKFFIYVN